MKVSWRTKHYGKYECKQSHLRGGDVLIDLTGDSVSADKVLKGITAHDKSGAKITGTCTFDSDTSEDTAAVAEILVGKTAHARGSKLTGTMKNNGAVKGIISTVAGEYTGTARLS